MRIKPLFNPIVVTLLASSLLACGSNKEDKEKFMLQGKQLFQTGNYKQAQQAFENAFKINPDDFDSQYQIAESLSKQGEVLKAFEAYQAVLNKDKQHLMARIRLAQLLLLNASWQTRKLCSNKCWKCFRKVLKHWCCRPILMC